MSYRFHENERYVRTIQDLSTDNENWSKAITLEMAEWAPFRLRILAGELYRKKSPFCMARKEIRASFEHVFCMIYKATELYDMNQPEIAEILLYNGLNFLNYLVEIVAHTPFRLSNSLLYRAESLYQSCCKEIGTHGVQTEGLFIRGMLCAFVLDTKNSSLKVLKNWIRVCPAKSVSEDLKRFTRQPTGKKECSVYKEGVLLILIDFCIRSYGLKLESRKFPFKDIPIRKSSPFVSLKPTLAILFFYCVMLGTGLYASSKTASSTQGGMSDIRKEADAHRGINGY